MEKSLKISSKQIENLVNKFKKYAHRKVNNPHLLFFCKLNNLTISIFKTKTILLQGNNDEIDHFTKQNLNSVKPQISKQVKFDKKTNKTNNSLNGLIGCDEVGVGDYFGPIVTCACYIDNTNLEKFKKLKIKDSKKLSDEYILQIAGFIKNHATLYVNICNNTTYNKLINKYENSKLVLSICHNLTLNKLQNLLNHKKYKIVMDEFVPETKYYKYLKKANEKIIKIDHFLTKAEDKYLAVACASIVARAIFLNYMTQIEHQLKIKIPLGASNNNEIVKIGKFINKNFSLQDVAKLHFKSITDKIIN